MTPHGTLHTPKFSGPARGALSAPAFTLVELLVVIGIITILLSLLIPVVGKIRIAAYEASTRNEIQEISTACNHYYDDFRAYPGPLSNTEIESQSPGVPITDTYSDSTGSAGNGAALFNMRPKFLNTASNTTMCFTATENLVLGLLGGLWNNNGVIQFVDNVPTGSPAAGTIPYTLIGHGPYSLATSSASTPSKQYTAYLSLTFPGSTLMLNGDGSPEELAFTNNPPIPPPTPFTVKNPPPTYFYGSGAYFMNSIVPVFTDQFPDHMPILYMRARVGAHGVISGPQSYMSAMGIVVSPSTSPPLVQDPTYTGMVAATYNYDLREIAPYTWSFNPPSLTVGGVGLFNGHGIVVTPGTMPQHGLQGVGGTASVPLPYYPVTMPPNSSQTTPASSGYPYNLPVPTNTPDNAGEYFLNASIQPSSTTAISGSTIQDTINATGTPRQKDAFILISAGRDRTYGTADDLTNFGDVEP